MKTAFVVTAALVAFGSVSFAAARPLNPSSTALLTQLGNEQSTETPYELLKKFYDSAPTAASLSDFDMCTLPASNPANPSNQKGTFSGYKILTVITDNSLTGVLESTTRSEISAAAATMLEAKDTVYLGKSQSQVLVREAEAAQPELPGQGPLFPGQPAHEAIAAQYANLPTQLSFVQAVVGQPLNCGFAAKIDDLNALKSSTSVTGNALVSKVSSKYYDLKLSVRKSGSLIAIKMEMVLPTNPTVTQTTYSYGWK